MSRTSDIEDIYELSPLQEGILFHSLQGDMKTYLLQSIYLVKSALDVEVVGKSLQILIQRHTALRTVFTYNEIDNPLQIVLKERRTDFWYKDLRDLEKKEQRKAISACEEAEYERELALDRDPLMRVGLIRIDENLFEFIWSCHHIIIDGWSKSILVKDFWGIYYALLAEEQREFKSLKPYRDYIQWLRKVDQKASHRYWEEYLRGYKGVNGFPGKSVCSGYTRQDHAVNFGEDISERLRLLGISLHVTVNTIIQSLWGLLLGRYSNSGDVVFGSVVSGRPAELSGVDEIIGLFINTVPVRIRFDSDSSLKELMIETQKLALESQSHHYSQLAHVQSISGAGLGLLDHVMVFENYPIEEQLAELIGYKGEIKEKEDIERHEQTNYDLAVVVHPGKEIVVKLLYNSSAYDSILIEGIGNQFLYLVRQLIENPLQMVQDLQILDTKERDELLLMSRGLSVKHPDKTLVDLFRNCVSSHPDHVAIVTGDIVLTYRELDERSGRIATCLQKGYKIRKGDIVGVFTDRNEYSIIGMLGIMMAGGAYLPLDPSYPTERLSYMLIDADVEVLMTDTSLMFALPTYKGQLFGLDLQLGEPMKNTDRMEVGKPDSMDLAYVIYTSGSTGRPKGVMIEHRSIVNTVLNQIDAFSINRYDRVLQFASVSFDASISEIGMAILSGVPLVLISRKRINEPETFLSFLEQNSVSVVTLPPTYLGQLDERRLLNIVRVIITAGEAARPLNLEKSQKLEHYYNAYGPTESSICATIYKVMPTDGMHASIPIGGPIANTDIYILDEYHQIVPVGVAGEIYIGGSGLARGYLNQPELTSEKFVLDSYKMRSGARMYRTGDLGRWLPDGNIEFMGRADNQIKIRGHRVEIGEIENMLQRHSQVSSAAVVVQGDGGGDKQLTAYIVPRHWKPQRMKDEYLLPNGMGIIQQNTNETDFLYNEIYERKIYFKNGIQIPVDACILDVGANIGIFMLYVSEHCPKGKVYAFEPISPTFECLKSNTMLCQANIKAFNIGLGAEEAIADFTFYPGYSGLSRLSIYDDQSGNMEMIKAFLRNELQHGEPSVEEFMKEGESILLERLQGRACKAQLRRLSSIIKEESIEHVDLLKIDVERSELDVLKGIDDGDWCKIDQIVLEVHTYPLTNEIFKLLEERGFKVVMEEDELLTETGIYNVYARKENRDRTTDHSMNNKKQLPIVTNELRQYLQEYLPEYMIPSTFIMLDHLPLLENGKVDRKALSVLKNDVKRTCEPPSNYIERQLVEVWEKVLDRRPIGVTDDFFSLGGHSLKAMQIVSAIHQKLSIKLDIGDIFSNPTIKGLSKVILQSTSVAIQSITPLESSLFYEASHAQKRLWIENRLNPNSKAYNIPAAYRLKGDLQVHTLKASMATLIERHEILRTIIVIIEGEPKQQVRSSETCGFDLVYEDIRGHLDMERKVSQLVQEQAEIVFNLERGPLLRATLWQIDDQEYIYALTMHHIISDGWSREILINELLTLYKAYAKAEPDTSAPLRIQYKDYANWQQQQLSGSVAQVHRQYWKEKFSDEVPRLAWPADFPRPATMRYEGSAVDIVLERDLVESLKQLSQRKGATLFMTLLAATKGLLYRYTGQEDLVLGTTAAERQHPDLENQIGFYVNTLPLRTRLSGEESFEELLEAVKKTTIDAYEHRMYPFDLLVEDLSLSGDMSRPPLFDILIEYQNAGTNERKRTYLLEGISVEDYDIRFSQSKYEIRIVFTEDIEEVYVHLEYNTALRKEASIQRMGKHLIGFLNAVVAESGAKLSALSFLSFEEQNRLVEHFNDLGYDPGNEATIIHQFELQVETYPDRVAAVFNDTSITYRELNNKVNQLAHYLLEEHRIKKGEVVALLMNRNEWVLIGLLGILKAGGAYLLLDPEAPPKRLAFMVNDAGVRLLITNTGFMFDLEWHKGQLFVTDLQLIQPIEHLAPVTNNITGNDMAYLIYTSGSTGEPKGVLIDHRSLANYVNWAAKYYFEGMECLKFGIFTPLTFDLTVTSIFTPILRGDVAYFCPDYGVRDTLSFVFDKRYSLDVVKITPSHVRELMSLPVIQTNVRCVILGGEALRLEDVSYLRKLNPLIKVFNEYGPTETTVGCTAGEIAGELLTIGQPVSNTDIYIFDNHLQLLPIGIEGEIYIGGAGLARGYLNHPELTAKQFIPHPFRPGRKLYKTGDRGSWNEKGELNYFGRSDEQVKIRGYRIELKEVEKVIERIMQSGQAAVVVNEDAQGNKQLVAYVQNQSQPDIDRLRQELLDYLPNYMMPVHFIGLDKFPLTENGKLDKKKLKEIEENPSQPYIAPRNEIEQQLVGIWEEVLGTHPIGVNDNFFLLGGYSLKATQVVFLIQQQLMVDIQLATLFKYPMIEQLALEIKNIVWIKNETPFEEGNKGKIVL